MKKYILSTIIFNLLIFVCSVSAQNVNTGSRDMKQSTSNTGKEMSGNKSMKMDPSMNKISMSMDQNKDYALMMDGKTYLRKNGKLMELENDALLGSMQVNSTGRITRKDGSFMMLKEGEAISSDGQVMMFDQNQVMRDRMRMMNENHTVMMDTRRDLADKLLMMNEKVNLLNRKTNLMNEKMAMMNQMMDKSKKMSKEQMQGLATGMVRINDEIMQTEGRMKEIDEKLSKSNSDMNSSSNK